MNQNVWKDFIALIYPNVCLTCHKPILSAEKFICVNCFLDLTRIQRESEGDNDLIRKFAAFPEVTLARSFMSFKRNGPAQKLVHAFKYNGHQMLAYFLGQLMAGESKQFFSKTDWNFIIPVPLHANRMKERGFNQSELLANGFGEVLNLPVSTDQVERLKKTQTQTGKDRISRWRSTSDIYAVTDQFRMEGKNILLLDDVITTGATISGLIELLTANGVGNIGIVSLASE